MDCFVASLLAMTAGQFGFSDHRCCVTSLTVDPVRRCARIASSAKEIAMTKDKTRDLPIDASKNELTEDQLEKAAGGTANVEHTIVSPRDAASGLPTGKRMHKPF
jgi:hypothetical protein